MLPKRNVFKIECLSYQLELQPATYPKHSKGYHIIFNYTL